MLLSSDADSMNILNFDIIEFKLAQHECLGFGNKQNLSHHVICKNCSGLAFFTFVLTLSIKLSQHTSSGFFFKILYFYILLIYVCLLYLEKTPPASSKLAFAVCLTSMYRSQAASDTVCSLHLSHPGTQWGAGIHAYVCLQRCDSE